MIYAQARLQKDLERFVWNTLTTAWSNLPLAEQVFKGEIYTGVREMDLTGYNQARLIIARAGGVGIATTKLRVTYAATWTSVIGSDICTSELGILCPTAGTRYDTGWIDLVDAVKTSTFLQLCGSGGDGAADPQFGTVETWFR